MPPKSATLKARTQQRTKKTGQKHQTAGHFIADQNGVILYANASFTANIPDLDDLKGQGLFDLVRFNDPDDSFRHAWLFGDKQNRNQDILSGLQSGVHTVVFNQSEKSLPLQFDWVNTADGRRLLIASEALDDPLSQDDVLGILTDQSADNNTHRKPSPSTQTKSADPFQDMSQDLMIVSHADGRLIQTNPAFNTLLGYESGAIDLITLHHTEDRPFVRSTLQDLIHQDQENTDPVDFDARMLTKDGQTVYINWRHQLLGDCIYSIGRDITAIKAQKANLIKREQQLTEAESIAHMGHWHWTLGEEQLLWSDEIYNIFGVTQDSFTPTLDSFTSMVHRQDSSRMMQAFQRAMLENNAYDMEFRIHTPDGETRYIRCEGRSETDEHGEVIALFGIMQDMTERALYEQDLRSAKDSAERAYASKSQFLANMSHELRTPLNAIIGFSEMMQRQLLGPIGTEKYLEYIGGIRESGEHLLDLISDILDMSKIEAGKYDLALEEVNLIKSIQLAVHMMEGRALESSVKIGIEANDDDIKMIADRRAVMQIILNLLSNAVKFSEDGGTVTIECHKRDDYISLKVSDEGIGIPANKLAVITNPFEQAASHYTRDHEGSGLGLAITKELIELHGGSLHIDSSVGVGTTVTIRLPFEAQTKT